MKDPAASKEGNWWRYVAMGCLMFAGLGACGGGGSEPDTTPPPTPPSVPAVFAFTPAQQQDEITPDATLYVTFTEQMDPTSAAGNVALRANGQAVPVTFSFDGFRMYVQPVSPLALNTRYTLAINAGFRSAQGVPLGTAFNLGFRTLRMVFDVATAEAHLMQTTADAAPLLVRDINQDGMLDVAVATSSLGGGVVRIYLGTPQGRLAEPVDYPFCSNYPVRALALDDLNGDGRIDMVMGGGAVCRVAVFLQDAHGVMQLDRQFPDQYAAGYEDSAWIRLADMDGDGRRDIVGMGTGLTIWYQQPDGSFGSGITQATPAWGQPFSGQSMELGDFNGDQRTDVLVAGGYQSHALFLLPQLANHSLGAATRLNLARDPGAMGLGDVDGNGFADVVVGGDGNTGEVFFGNSAGIATTSSSFAPAAGGSAIAIGDLDGNGRNDVLAMQGQAGRMQITFQESDGTFSHPYFISVPYSRIPAEGLALADLDRDGKLDVIVAYPGSLKVFRRIN